MRLVLGIGLNLYLRGRLYLKFVGKINHGVLKLLNRERLDGWAIAFTLPLAANMN